MARRDDPSRCGSLEHHARTRPRSWPACTRDEEERTRRLFGLVSWQDITIPIADRAGELRRARPATGGDTVNYLLAAATELLSAELATMNVRHFPMIEGLEAPY